MKSKYVVGLVPTGAGIAFAIVALQLPSNNNAFVDRDLPNPTAMILVLTPVDAPSGGEPEEILTTGEEVPS